MPELFVLAEGVVYVRTESAKELAVNVFYWDFDFMVVVKPVLNCL